MRNMHLTKAREERGWSYQEVADKIGVPERRIHAWEMGTENPSFQNKKKLCGLFNLDMNRLGFFIQGPLQVEHPKNKSKGKKNSSSSIINVSDRTSGRARRVRRGS